jgi:peptidoglycan hydrolase-like protein with peptidoglycan-binding domain
VSFKTVARTTRINLGRGLRGSLVPRSLLATRAALVVGFVVLGSMAVGGLWSAPAYAAPSPINLTSSQCPTFIAMGESDGCVVELQNLLKGHGYSVTADGIFGNGTFNAVKSFQTAHGLVADGIVGPKTKTALYDDNGGSHSGSGVDLRTDCGVLQYGASGPCVIKLQQLLNTFGAGLTVDGQFGQGTNTAVRLFQRNHGLVVDGVVGPATKTALYGGGGGGGGSGGVDLRSDCGELAQGTSGICVIKLQQLLNTFGAGLTVDGDFGPATTTAVRNFQSSHGLTADGIVGRNTKAALYGQSGGGGSGGTIDLRTDCGYLMQGMSGPCVTRLQQLLNGFGYGLTVDGQFGIGTATAVSNFQTSKGLTADGIVGPMTKAALYGQTSGGGSNGGGGPGSTEGGVIDFQKVIAKARTQIGVPYSWGGGHGATPGKTLGTCTGYTGSILPCPADSTVGFDCSGLVRYAFWAGAGIDLARGGNTDSQTQDPHVIPILESQRQAGDIEFFGGTDGHHATHHVILYTGGNMMIEAQQTGTNVHEVSLRTGGFWYRVEP